MHADLAISARDNQICAEIAKYAQR